MKFLIADDHDIVRLGVKLLLQKKYPDAGVTEITDYNKILGKLKGDDYDLLILDIHMQETCTIEFIRHLISLKPALRIIILSYLPEDVFAIHYLKAGVMAYIHKKYDTEILSKAVDCVLTDRKFLTAGVNERMLHKDTGDENLFARLSEREIEVLHYMLQGYVSSEICNKMNLHSTTISTYKNRIFEKLHTNNIMELNELVTIHDLLKKP